MASPRFTCLLLVTLSWSHVSAQEVPLLWKFDVGGEYQYRLTQQMDMEMSLGAANRNVNTEFRQVIDLTWKIEQIDDQGRAKIAQSVARMQMDLRAPGDQEMHFDTDAKESPTGFAAMLVPLVKALTSETINLTITPRGKIENVEVPESLTKTMQAIPGATMMGDLFSQTGFQNMIQQSSPVLPQSAELKPGHEWTRKSELHHEQIGVVQAETTYHYVGNREAEGEKELLEVFTVQMKFAFDDGNESSQIKVVDHQSDGELLFNRSAGQLHSSNLQQNLTLKLDSGEDTTMQKMIHNTILTRINESTETDP
ncbi:MAG: DUF6263 family protein [Bythopirellula sp.]